MVRGPRRPWAAGSSSRTKPAGDGGAARTELGPRGSTPVVRVRGRGSGRVPMAGLTCYRPGGRSQMCYLLFGYRGRKGEPKSIGMRDLRELLIGRTSSLGGLIVAVWGNL